jgi:hypothetical protein
MDDRALADLVREVRGELRQAEARLGIYETVLRSGAVADSRPSDYWLRHLGALHARIGELYGRVLDRHGRREARHPRDRRAER